MLKSLSVPVGYVPENCRDWQNETKYFPRIIETANGKLANGECCLAWIIGKNSNRHTVKQISGYLDEKLSVIRISVNGGYFQTLMHVTCAAEYACVVLFLVANSFQNDLKLVDKRLYSFISHSSSDFSSFN